jgi:general stress protein YciG
VLYFTVPFLKPYYAYKYLPRLKGGNIMAGDNTSNRGFASMDDDKQREIASKGGRSQGKENNPGNFANDRKKASEAGREGGKNSGGNNS